MRLHIPSLLIGVAFFLGMAMASPAPQVPANAGLTQAQRDILNLLSIEYFDDCGGGPGYKTLRVTGANFQVVNGLGTTNTTNGLGNLLIGYQESAFATCDHSGSHNIVGGIDSDYASYGGAVLGTNNYINGILASVLGGQSNTGSGWNSVIVGGEGSLTLGSMSVLSGGHNRLTNGVHDWVAGGLMQDM